MSEIAQRLNAYIQSHPFDAGDSDCESVLDQLYQAYIQSHEGDPEEIKGHLIAQLTSPVRWTQSVRHMLADGATSFTECGPGNVLTGLIRKIK